MINQKRIPFIPKLSREFKPMKHYLCETDTSAKLLSRSVFMRLLAQQPCPKGQVFIDLDDGIVYLFPYEPERAERFMAAYQEFETEYKRVYREHHDPRAERLRKAESLDQREDATDADGKPKKSVLVSEVTPESEFLTKEHFIIHTSSFKALSDSDREILTGFINAGYNARELARRLGKDPSGVLKLVKRAAARLEKKIEEYAH